MYEAWNERTARIGQPVARREGDPEHHARSLHELEDALGVLVLLDRQDPRARSEDGPSIEFFAGEVNPRRRRHRKFSSPGVITSFVIAGSCVVSRFICVLCSGVLVEARA